ncbi:MAG: carbohydrate ABC transporter permease [Anaerolineae bacterium]
MLAISKRVRLMVSNGMLYVILIVAAALILFPVLWGFYVSFMKKSDILGTRLIVLELTLDNYREILALPQLYGSMLNSTIASLGATLVAILIGLPSAYALIHFPRIGGEKIAMAVLVFRMLPGIALIIPSFLMFRNLNMLDTHVALVAMYLTFSLPFTVWTLRGYMASIPTDIHDAALLDGCSRLSVLRLIYIPVMWPAILATSVITFLFCWNDFLFALIITDQRALTFLPYLTRFILPNETLFGQIFAGTTFFLLPVIAALIILRRQISQSFGLGLV